MVLNLLVVDSIFKSYCTKIGLLFFNLKDLWHIVSFRGYFVKINFLIHLKRIIHDGIEVFFILNTNWYWSWNINSLFAKKKNFTWFVLVLYRISSTEHNSTTLLNTKIIKTNVSHCQKFNSLKTLFAKTKFHSC